MIILFIYTSNIWEKYGKHDFRRCSTCIGYLNIHGTHVTAYNFTDNNVLFFASDLKILYYNNY